MFKSFFSMRHLFLALACWRKRPVCGGARNFAPKYKFATWWNGIEWAFQTADSDDHATVCAREKPPSGKIKKKKSGNNKI